MRAVKPLGCAWEIQEFPFQPQGTVELRHSSRPWPKEPHHIILLKFHLFFLQKKEGQNELSLKKSREVRDPPDNCIQARNTNVYVAHQARHCCPTLVETCAQQVNQLETNLQRMQSKPVQAAWIHNVKVFSASVGKLATCSKSLMFLGVIGAGTHCI